VKNCQNSDTDIICTDQFAAKVFPSGKLVDVAGKDEGSMCNFKKV
jgi:hypothetical protein